MTQCQCNKLYNCFISSVLFEPAKIRLKFVEIERTPCKMTIILVTLSSLLPFARLAGHLRPGFREDLENLVVARILITQATRALPYTIFRATVVKSDIVLRADCGSTV